MKFFRKHPKKKIVGLVLGGLLLIVLLLQMPAPWSPTLGAWLQQQYGSTPMQPDEINGDGSFNFWSRLPPTGFSRQDNWAVDLVENIHLTAEPETVMFLRSECGVEPVTARDEFSNVPNVGRGDAHLDFRFLTSVELLELRVWLANVDRTLDIMAAATTKTRFVFPRKRPTVGEAGSVVSTLLWEANGYNAIFSALMLRAKLRILDGEFKSALADIQAAWRISNSIRRGPFLVYAIRGGWMANESLELLGFLMQRESALTVEDYRALLLLLSQTDQSPPLSDEYATLAEWLDFDFLQVLAWGNSEKMGLSEQTLAKKPYEQLSFLIGPRLPTLRETAGRN